MGKDFADNLNGLYNDIMNCHLCPKMDGEKTLRLTAAVSPNSDVFIISQSLAANQVRRSGVNFFQSDGRLGSTGNNLERFLNRFGRTVYPCREVRVSSGDAIPECDSSYLPVYNTEIAQCYPGKRTGVKGDRPPDGEEIDTCLKQGFLFVLSPPRLTATTGNRRTPFQAAP